MVPELAVTGVTGRLGSRVAARLAERGVPQRMVVRDPNRAPSPAGSEVAQAAYDDPAAVVSALSGVGTVFMVSAAEHPARLSQHHAFVDGAVRAGVRHLVYTSFLGAGPASTFTLGRDHWHTEQYIRASGLGYTFLRDSLYADFTPSLVGPDGVIRGPAGDGRVSLVAQDDIADAAVAVLLDPGAHSATTYDMTGPEALTLSQVAAVLTEATGRGVSYEEETIAEAYASRTSYGAPDWQLDAWVSTYTAIATGELAAISDDVALLTGRPATTLRAVLAT